ncbi:MAG TPA: M48 family metallopeptidase [Nitrospiraceae bacterium]|nr:M48 family metallopeptidase [Nitrospiraceae bacterium]
MPSGLSVTRNGRADALSPELIPFGSLSVSAGGLDHDQLVVSWGSLESARTLYLKSPDLIIAFRRAAPPELTAHLDRTAEQVRRARHAHRGLWIAGAAAIIGLAVMFWFGTDLMVEWAVKRIPVEWEQQLGAVAYRQMLSGQSIVKEGPAVEAVQEITRRLTAQAPDTYRFEVSVVRNDVVNAFALPGGYVIVFTGLIQKAESGEEVAGVLSHEISHVLERHGMERIIKQSGLAAVVTVVLGDQQGLIGLAQQLGMKLATLKFSREQETEADLSGLRLLRKARIAPGGMIRFFDRLSEQDMHQIELFSTHPMSASRAKRLETETASLAEGPPEPFTFDWNLVRQSLDHDKGQGSKAS